MSSDDDLLPKKATSSAAKSPSRSSAKSRNVSSQMRRLMRVTRALGLVLGGLVSVVGIMSVVGLVTDNFWARLIVALVVVVGLPAFVSDRLLKRMNLGGGVSVVGDVFAIVLLTAALVLVSLSFVSKPLLVREGDRYARSGSRTTARVVYFLGGVSPTFPDEKGVSPAPSASASGSNRIEPDASTSGPK